jgi:glucokinase
MVRLNAECHMLNAERYSIGCDVGGTEVKVAVLRGTRIVHRGRFPTPTRDGREFTGGIASAVRDALATVDRRGAAGVTLGLALPGFLDARRDRPVHLSHIPALDGFPLRRTLERRLGWPVVLDADSNAGAYGEWRLGAGRGARRLLYVTLGTGLGAAMVAGGEIVRVSNHTVGQAAHLPLEPGGPRCPCGARGCAEAVLAAPGILLRARRAAREDRGIPRRAVRDTRSLCEAARGGCRGAIGVWDDVGRLLGRALAMLANFLSPERIVVGGGISAAGDLLLAPARRSFEERVHPRLRGAAIAGARLGPFAGAAGAALLGKRAGCRL